MKRAFTFLAAMAAVVSLNAEVLWEADFSKELAGFTIFKQKAEDSVKVENNELVFNFTNGINKGMGIKQTIPFPERGEFSFDAIMNVGSKPGYGAWSMQLSFFGKLLAWNGSNGPGFASFTGTGWDRITKSINNKKINYRIRFDRTKKTLEFFIDGALIPEKVITDVKFKDPVDGQGLITFANYGYASGKLTHKISNLKLETISESADVLEEKVVWTEKFEKNGTLMDNGYIQVRDNKKDSFLVKDGVLTMICQNSPYKGSVFQKKVPGVVRGEMTFELRVNSALGYDHYAFTMILGDMMMSWNRTSQLHLYKGNNQWTTVSSKIKVGTWQKYKICFDTIANETIFYVDDMENPVYIYEGKVHNPKREIKFDLRNYGLCSGAITTQIRNIEVKAVPEKKKTDSVTLNGTLILRGPSDNYWKLKELAQKLGTSKVSEFSIAPSGYHVDNSPNAYVMDPKPNPALGPFQYIILADMPLKPIPPYVRKRIINSVENGGTLIILGGLFTLQKGGFAGSEFEPLLPVSVKDLWKEVTALPDAKVFKYNGRDAVISRAYGKGMVHVVPGNTVKNPEIADVFDHFKF